MRIRFDDLKLVRRGLELAELDYQTKSENEAMRALHGSLETRPRHEARANEYFMRACEARYLAERIAEAMR